MSHNIVKSAYTQMQFDTKGPFKFGKNLRLATLNIMMVANAFIWYLLAFNTLKELVAQQSASTSDTLLIFGVNTSAIVLAGLIGSFLADKIKKKTHFLYIWLASGIVLSLIPLGLNVGNITHLIIISLIFGVYFGLGMPATMGYHSALTNTESRGRIGGASFLIIAFTFAIAGLLIFDSLVITCLVLTFVRLMGLLFFHFIRGKEEPKQDMLKLKYSGILTNRSFLFYFIPWCMFTLINYLTIPIQRNIFETDASYQFLTSMENVVIALFAVVSGFVADKFGRKRLTIIGFIMLGIGYAVIGLFSASTSSLLWGSIIYIIADGVAWGIFYVLFVFTLWGDLAQDRTSYKLYFLGALPFVTSYFVQLVLTPYLKEIDITTIFSFSSVFLFLAVLPLIYAPETLSEKVMKDRDLKSYIEKAKNKAEKTSWKKSRKQDIKEQTEPTESDNSYAEAKALAEKYY